MDISLTKIKVGRVYLIQFSGEISDLSPPNDIKNFKVDINV